MIGRMIKVTLDEQGRTIKWLSKETGISVNTLYAIIKRDSDRISSESLQKICDALGIPLPVLKIANAKSEPGRWIETTDCEPLEDGEYMVQTKYGRVTSMLYTFKGGWNTHYTTDGELKDKDRIESDYIIRWFDLPKPPELKGGE